MAKMKLEPVVGDFPRFVFLSPGKLDCGKGRTYDHVLVTSQEEYDEAIKEGFSATVEAAIEAGKK